MRISVVVRSKDEADRLRLTLASLSRQTMPAEVIVVNDASTDHTPAVLAEAARAMPLVVVTHAAPRGRAGATNAGARVATGDVLVFLDGDTLAAPDWVAQHAAVHSAGSPRIGRGERFHVRSTRFLLGAGGGHVDAGDAARSSKASPL